jgi:hypothetical protein
MNTKTITLIYENRKGEGIVKLFPFHELAHEIGKRRRAREECAAWFYDTCDGERYKVGAVWKHRDDSNPRRLWQCFHMTPEAIESLSK